SRIDELDTDSRRRLQQNPLRILDSKVARTQEILADAPDLLDFIDDEDCSSFEILQGLLRAAGVEFQVNSRLVRGLDYYTGIVFEWTTDQLGAQNAICAGGRYDGLVEQLGGRSVPAAGFACGLERLIELTRLGGHLAPPVPPDIWVAIVDQAAIASGFGYSEKLRDAGYKVVANCGGGGLKKQMRRADGSGALVALVVGTEELRTQCVSVKPLRTNAPQVSVADGELLAHLKQHFDMEQ
ncbi:MAG: ATP phosphoribosyltransferase regulatory subunit, partial [Arenicellales bacterium]|nr:ATP phosphoribosyltransferase regulatory subunit [Arenicellales bacterium]